MKPVPNYLVDSDVLITAKNRYDALGICPGFWDSILYGHSCGHLHRIDRVKQELLRGSKDDDLVQWVGQCVPAGFFLASGGSEVVASYRRVMLWVNRHKQYRDEAKAKFASDADGWLVAHGMATGKTVVTLEQSSPESLTAIKLPDVCHAFSVPCGNIFAMLHRLGVRYHYSPQHLLTPASGPIKVERVPLWWGEYPGALQGEEGWTVCSGSVGNSLT